MRMAHVTCELLQEACVDHLVSTTTTTAAPTTSTTSTPSLPDALVTATYLNQIQQQAHLLLSFYKDSSSLQHDTAPSTSKDALLKQLEMDALDTNSDSSNPPLHLFYQRYRTIKLNHQRNNSSNDLAIPLSVEKDRLTLSRTHPMIVQGKQYQTQQLIMIMLY